MYGKLLDIIVSIIAVDIYNIFAKTHFEMQVISQIICQVSPAGCKQRVIVKTFRETKQINVEKSVNETESKV